MRPRYRSRWLWVLWVLLRRLSCATMLLVLAHPKLGRPGAGIASAISREMRSRGELLLRDRSVSWPAPLRSGGELLLRDRSVSWCTPLRHARPALLHTRAALSCTSWRSRCPIALDSC